MQIRSDSRHKLLLLVIWTCWSVLFVALGARHISWRDEYQSWLVATRTENWPDFFEAVRYERHPPLHYLLERSARDIAVDFYPEKTQQISESPALFKSVTYLFSILNVGLVVFFFPMGLIWRVLVSLGILFVLEYGIISRTYAIGTFFLFAAALFERNSRVSKKAQIDNLLAFTCYSASAFTHLYFTLIVGALMCFRFLPLRPLSQMACKMKKLRWPLAAGLVVAVSIFMQRPPLDSVFAVGPNPLKLNISRFFKNFAWGLTGFDHLWGSFEWNDTPTEIGFLALLYLYLLWRNRKTETFPWREYFFIAFTPMILMNMAYAPYTRHVLIFWVALLYFVFREQRLPMYFRAMVLCMCFASFHFLIAWAPWQTTPNFDFSGQQELIQAIGSDLQATDSILVVENEDIFFPVMGHLGINVFAAKRDRILKYVFFKKSEWKMSLASWCTNGGVAKLKSEYKRIFIGIEQGKLLPVECGAAQVVFQTQRPVITDERYTIFNVP